MPGGAVTSCAGAVGRGLSRPAGMGADADARRSRAVYQCNRCKHQVGLTAGTVFHWTKLPLTTWFLAIYHLTQSKGGMSSVELARRLGTRQPTAWLLKHKLMAAMAAREAAKPRLAGRVEVDDAYLGGARSAASAAGCRRQDAVRGRGRDDRRAQAQAAQAHRRQGLPQEGDRGPGQARFRRRQQRRQRRPVLLAGGRAGRLHAFCDGHRQGAAGRQVGTLHYGSTPPSATSRRHSPAPAITSAPVRP